MIMGDKGFVDDVDSGTNALDNDDFGNKDEGTGTEGVGTDTMDAGTEDEGKMDGEEASPVLQCILMDWAYEKLESCAGCTVQEANEWLNDELLAMLDENLKVWQQHKVMGLDSEGNVTWMIGKHGTIFFEDDTLEDTESEEDSLPEVSPAHSREFG